MRAQENEIPWEQLSLALTALEQACTAFDYEQIRTLLLKTVAEYQPQCGIEDLIWQASHAAADNMTDVKVLH
jgi:FlaA1/EpsC-like NDP-sugar epimerase